MKSCYVFVVVTHCAVQLPIFETLRRSYTVTVINLHTYDILIIHLLASGHFIYVYIYILYCISPRFCDAVQWYLLFNITPIFIVYHPLDLVWLGLVLSVWTQNVFLRHVHEYVHSPCNMFLCVWPVFLCPWTADVFIYNYVMLLNIYTTSGYISCVSILYHSPKL